MNNIKIYSILFIVSFLATMLLTRLLISYLSNLGIVDVPGKRRSHDTVIPRGGGLAIVLVVMFAFTIFEFLTTTTFFVSLKLIPLLFIIATISFLDDLKSISISVRLVIHLICSGFVVYLFLYSELHSEYIIPLYIITAIVLTGFINIYNFMDGIDGMSCIESIHLSVTTLILCYLQFAQINNVYLIITLSIIILGCCLGFLIFNWHPARIFLGDIGSISLGFLTGLCLLLLSLSSIKLFIACIIACFYYITDAGLTILIRLFNKEKIWLPHVQHFFQKAVQSGKSHNQVVNNIAVSNIFLMILSITSLYFPIIATILSLFIMILTVMNLLR